MTSINNNNNSVTSPLPEFLKKGISFEYKNQYKLAGFIVKLITTDELNELESKLRQQFIQINQLLDENKTDSKEKCFRLLSIGLNGNEEVSNEQLSQMSNEQLSQMSKKCEYIIANLSTTKKTTQSQLPSISVNKEYKQWDELKIQSNEVLQMIFDHINSNREQGDKQLSALSRVCKTWKYLIGTQQSTINFDKIFASTLADENKKTSVDVNIVVLPVDPEFNANDKEARLFNCALAIGDQVFQLKKDHTLRNDSLDLFKDSHRLAFLDSKRICTLSFAKEEDIDAVKQVLTNPGVRQSNSSFAVDAASLLTESLKITPKTSAEDLETLKKYASQDHFEREDDEEPVPVYKDHENNKYKFESHTALDNYSSGIQDNEIDLILLKAIDQLFYNTFNKFSVNSEKYLSNIPTADCRFGEPIKSKYFTYFKPD